MTYFQTCPEKTLFHIQNYPSVLVTSLAFSGNFI